MTRNSSDIEKTKFAERLRQVTSSNRGSLHTRIVAMREVSKQFELTRMTVEQVSLAYAELGKRYKEKQTNEVVK